MYIRSRIYSSIQQKSKRAETNSCLSLLPSRPSLDLSTYNDGRALHLRESCNQMATREVSLPFGTTLRSTSKRSSMMMMGSFAIFSEWSNFGSTCLMIIVYALQDVTKKLIWNRLTELLVNFN
ncbi:hypothetical protein Tco_1279002, partial [Tanacetum coccineum]